MRYVANPYFVGREADLNRIHEALHENPTAALTEGRARAITALGGIGKTTLARQYIEKFWHCYPQVFWVDCRLGIEREFARLCELLFPETRDGTNVGKKAQQALRELQTRNGRLLILDNAEDEVSIQAWIAEQSYGADHPDVAVNLNNLARFLYATKRFSEAEPLMRRALAIDIQRYGPDHPNVANDLNNLAQLLKASLRFTEAKPMMRRTAAILLKFTRHTGHEHPHLRMVLGNYVALLKAMGRSQSDVDAALQKLMTE